MKISRLKNKKFIGLTKDFLLILAILDKISKKLKNDEKRLKIEKKIHFIDQKLLKIVKICLILQKIQRFPQNGSKLAKYFGIGVHFFFHRKYSWCSLFRIYLWDPKSLCFFLNFWISHNLSEILHVQQGDLIAKRAKIGISKKVVRSRIFDDF